MEFEQANAGWNILSLKGRIGKPLLSLLVCSELKSVIKKKTTNKQGVSTRIVLRFTEAHWEPNQLSKMKLFAKIVNG